MNETATPAPTVVVHCGHLAQAAHVERRLRAVIRSVPKDVHIVGTALRPVRLSPQVARRSRIEVITDGGQSLVDRLFSVDAPFIVVPVTASVDVGWLEPLLERSRNSPGTLGVVRCGAEFLFVCSREAVSLASPRALWEGMPGIRINAADATSCTPAAAMPTRRTLSAVYIVKNEERVLAESLRAVIPLVDEVVIYDTGSTDGTLDIARDHHAKTVEGYWDDDFAAARNRALAHARGDWILSIDADEVFSGEPELVRQWIDRATTPRAMVDIVNTAYDSADTGVDSRTVRLFRRDGAQWAGALHEQLLFADDPLHIVEPSVPPMRLVHSGYSATAVASKKDRNVTVVRAALARLGPEHADRSDLTSHLARSLFSGGSPDEAIATAATLLDRPAAPGNMVQLARVVVPAALNRSDLPLAHRWIDAADTFGEAPGQLVVWRASALGIAGEIEQTEQMLLELVQGGSEAAGKDYWHSPFDLMQAEAALAEVEHHRGKHELAAARMLRVLDDRPETVSLPALDRVLAGAGWSTGQLVRRAPQRFLDRSLRDMMTMEVQAALIWFAAMIEEYPDDARPVVAGCIVSSRSGWRDAAEWAVHARSRGITDPCPLRLLAQNQASDTVDRLAAWGLLAQGFDEADALGEARTLLSAVPAHATGQTYRALQRALPGLVDDLMPRTPLPA